MYNLALAKIHHVLTVLFHHFEMDLAETVREREINGVRDVFVSTSVIGTKEVRVRVIREEEMWGAWIVERGRRGLEIESCCLETTGVLGKLAGVLITLALFKLLPYRSRKVI